MSLAELLALIHTQLDEDGAQLPMLVFNIATEDRSDLDDYRESTGDLYDAEQAIVAEFFDTNIAAALCVGTVENSRGKSLAGNSVVAAITTTNGQQALTGHTSNTTIDTPFVLRQDDSTILKDRGILTIGRRGQSFIIEHDFLVTKIAGQDPQPKDRIYVVRTGQEIVEKIISALKPFLGTPEYSHAEIELAVSNALQAITQLYDVYYKIHIDYIVGSIIVDVNAELYGEMKFYVLVKV